MANMIRASRWLAGPVLVVAVLTLCPYAAQAQARIGSVQLDIGEDSWTVVERLHRSYGIRCYDSEQLGYESGQFDGTCTVLSKDGPPDRFFGSVSFQDGLLVSVGRDWAPVDGDDGFALGAAIVAALSNLEVSARGTPCTIEPTRRSEPQVEHKGVRIRCGFHSVSISSLEATPARGTAITETWSASTVWP